MNRPKKCISIESAKELQNNWKNSRGKEIMRGQGYEDTREFYFGVDELQEYLNYVKEKSLEQGIENPGIRIYFAAYPKNGPKKSYSTVFFAPTKGGGALETEGGSENNYEIEPLNTVIGGKPPIDY